MLRLLILATCLLLALIPKSNALAADGLSVMPMRVNLDNAQRSAEITISNGGPGPEMLRVTAMSWEQVDGKDHYAPSEALLVVPPLLRVDVGDEKVVRLGLRGLLSGTREHAFRIFFTEVPSAVRKSGGPAVQITMRLAVPVYANAGSLKSTQAADAGLTASAQLSGGKRVRLKLADAGDRHVVITSIRMYADASKSRIVGGQSKTEALLAGADRAFDLTANEPLTLPTLVVAGTGATGPFDLVVPVIQTGAH
jgi:fimbrial chaperone protein